MKKTLVSIASFGLVLTLMPGLWGCANERNGSGTCPATQPQPLSNKGTENAVAQADGDEVDDLEFEVENRHPVKQQFDRQIYNAELADMYMSDLHFLPNRSGLNGTGTQRLSHLAWLIDKYGGEINLDLGDPKSKLSQERLVTVKKFLQTYGLAESKIQVCMGLPQGHGIDAKEAIVIHNDTRFKPKKEGQSEVTVPLK